jgi:hypothetical protein
VKKKIIKQSFTLIEIIIAIAIFSTAIFVLIEKRNIGLEAAYYSVNLFESQKIIDEVLADYRLHPFSEQPLPLKKDYESFVVDVSVEKESVNILPEEWRVDEDEYGEEDRKKKRIILRVTVDVAFGTLENPKPEKHYKISTLIRHIELEKEEDDD